MTTRRVKRSAIVALAAVVGVAACGPDDANTAADIAATTTTGPLMSTTTSTMPGYEPPPSVTTTTTGWSTTTTVFPGTTTSVPMPTTSSTSTTAVPAPGVADYPPLFVGEAFVIDGDTVDVDDTRVRLEGIDTPERGECNYETASDHLEDLIADGEVTVRSSGATGRYDRTLGYLEVDGRDLNLAQIEAGYAIARYDSRDGYPAHPREDSYRAVDEATEQVAECGP